MRIWLWILVFNTTFSNISAISWRPVLVVEEASGTNTFVVLRLVTNVALIEGARVAHWVRSLDLTAQQAIKIQLFTKRVGLNLISISLNINTCRVGVKNNHSLAYYRGVKYLWKKNTNVKFYSASSMKQQSAGKHVALFGHIILIPSQAVFALFLLNYFLPLQVHSSENLGVEMKDWMNLLFWYYVYMRSCNEHTTMHCV
jgi:hypothetical protein